MKNIIFECVGFSTNPVYLKLDNGWFYHFGYVDDRGFGINFEYYDGFLPREMSKPNLPSSEEVLLEYNKKFKECGPWIGNDIVKAG